MQRAGELLGRSLRRLERPEAALAWLTASWHDIVGKALAAHTRPVRCEKGLLEISAGSKSWRRELEHLKNQFCARINQAWGGTLVRQIKFVTAKPGPRRLPREADESHTPFIRRKKPPK